VSEPQRPSDSTDSNEPAAAASPTSPVGLPESQPLTPELLEDEAIRGDFVIKWAVILLAVLAGSTVIAETMTLVHVKTGQHLAARGWIPPANDFLSHTAADRPWVNLSWLFDLLAAGVVAVGSWAGLTVVKAILAGVTFAFLLKTSRPGLSTWWGSITAALALIACQPQFTAQPELITLLGLALTLWILHSWKDEASVEQIVEPTGAERKLWLLVPLFLLWSNLDSRMFLGPLAVLLFAIGNQLESFRSRGSQTVPRWGSQIWIVFAAGCVAAMIHPFGWKWLSAPFTLVQTLYPEMREYAPSNPRGYYLQYFPVASAAYFRGIDLAGIAALVLFVLAAGAMILNRARVSFAHVLLLVGFLAVPLPGAHELPAASLVFAVIAALNGQAWYAARFPRDYRVTLPAVLFARGGRALTVVALFAIALFVATGRLRGPSGAQLGLGLDRSLRDAMDSFAEQLKEQVDDHPFNFVLQQGDLLIWTGKKPFVDSRVVMYAGPGENLLQVHRNVREAVAPHGGTQDQRPDPRIWKPIFDQYQITHALPRLTGASPDYRTLRMLLGSGEWMLFSLGSATAVLYRTDIQQPELRDFIVKNRENFLRQAFREEGPEIPPRPAWVRPPSFYDRWVWRNDRHLSAEVQKARHLLSLVGTPIFQGSELLYLTIRNLQRGLVENPDDADAYFLLGQAYGFLGQMEVMVRGQPGAELPQMRYLQAVVSLNQSLVAEPDNVEAHEALLMLYRPTNRLDLMQREIRALVELAKGGQQSVNPQMPRLEQLQQLDTQIEDVVKQVDTEVNKLVQQGATAAQVANLYFQRGCILKSLDQFRMNPQLLEDPEQMAMYLRLLLEAGRAEEAYMVGAQLEAMSEQTGYQQWRGGRAMTHLANGDYGAAIQLWKEQAELVDTAAFARLLGGLPPRIHPSSEVQWPIGEILAAAQYVGQTARDVSNFLTTAGMIELEAGRREDSIATFRRALERDPETSDRPLVSYYLTMLTGEQIDPLPPSERIPILFEAEESSPTADEPAESPKNE